VDVRTFSNDPKEKYHGTYDTDGFGVVIRNLSEADLNVTYRCNGTKQCQILSVISDLFFYNPLKLT
jgi:hypothetical protein